jgi:uncharacterized membrane protein YesL
VSEPLKEPSGWRLLVANLLGLLVAFVAGVLGVALALAIGWPPDPVFWVVSLGTALLLTPWLMDRLYYDPFSDYYEQRWIRGRQN